MTSILVRKLCQPVLDRAGYPMFHATISNNYHNPTLEIYTTCGKPFATIHGVRFSRRKPTVAEAEYSATLLQEWLNRHLKDFDSYVDVYTEFYSRKKPDTSINLEKDVNLQVDIRSKLADLKRPYEARDLQGQKLKYQYSVIFDPYTGKVNAIAWPSGALTHSEITAMLKIPAKYLKQARTMIEQSLDFNECRKRFDEAQSKLSSCNI